jgi:spore germination protein YaaH
MKFFLVLLTLLFSSVNNIAQSGKTIHQQELEYYNSLPNSNANYYESINQPSSIINNEKSGCELNKVVYGWHPYWVGSVYQNYNWDLLSHFSFFSYELNPADGEAITTHGWSSSSAVDAALNSGNTKVTLTVTLFSNHATFFNSSSAQQTLITNLINLVQNRSAHGVNIDIEGLPATYKIAFANFMVDLCVQMHSAIPGSEVSTVLYAVDWNNVFDFSIMEPHVDHYIVMGYAYYYQGSSTAGPCDPLYHFGSTYNYTISKTTSYYLDKGCPKEKLIMGLPYYGYQWPTTTLTMPSSTTASGSAKTYKQVKDNSSGNYSISNHLFDQESYTDVYAFNDGGNYQCFITQEVGFRKRLAHVNQSGIGGIGIWALGYDDGYNEFWNSIDEYLTDCFDDSCSQQMHDFGGPIKDYYNNEDYVWAISPDSATALTFDFSFFDLETNYDYLYVYDGLDVNSTQLPGSPFTGLNGPGIFTSSTGAVTFRFYSDGATVNPGFLANYQCAYSQPVSTTKIIDDILVYPNPAKDFLIISMSNYSEPMKLKIVDLSGKIIDEKEINNYEGVIDISELNSGFYLLRINSNSLISFIKE